MGRLLEHHHGRQPAGRPGDERRLTKLCWIAVTALGVLQAAAGATREAMNPDGISYLDMATAYLRGEWQTALNGYWSPLYPGLLAIALGVARPTPEAEYSVVHVVNLMLYLAALACFAFFWREVMGRSEHPARAVRKEEEWASLPVWAWVTVGYALFAWSSLALIEVWSATPDLGVAALIYLAAGLVLRVSRGAGSSGSYLLLGIVLGISYWSKTAMFPLALVFLGTCIVAARQWRGPMLALASFALTAAPLVVGLSLKEGRPTFGESARLNYAWYVNGVPQFHWQGDMPGNGTPLHPTRRLLDSPTVYEFGEPVGGTYPPWYDPTYWYEGVRTRFDVSEQLQAIGANARLYYELLFRQLGGLLAGAFVLYGVSGPWRAPRRMAVWRLLVPALAAFGMYGMVHVEGRFVAPFIILLWGSVLVGIHLPDTQLSRKVAAAVGTVMILVLLVDLGVYAVQRRNAFASPRFARPSDVAEGLLRLGVQEGEQVAFLGRSVDTYWARPARLRIVAETYEPPGPEFWSDREAWRRTVQTLAGAGVTAVVSRDVPRNRLQAGWRRVGHTDHFVLRLATAPGRGPRR